MPKTQAMVGNWSRVAFVFNRAQRKTPKLYRRVPEKSQSLV
jgi:hypothetical protein